MSYVMLIDPSVWSFYVVFGWFQDSFAGIERESPYILSVGYLKGAEQAGTSAALMLNVIMKFMNARKQPCSYNIVNSSTCLYKPQMGIEPTYSGPGRCDDLPIIIELPNPWEQCGGELD